MKVSVSQPCYLPWSGLFDRIAKSDIHVILDHVPMSGEENRNRILTANGVQVLTVPIGKRTNVPIRDVEIANDRHWQRKHLAAIRQSYIRSPYGEHHMPFFADLYAQQHHNLTDVIYSVMEYIMQQWGIATPLVKSSDLDARGSKTELNLNICKEIGATQFIVGSGTYSFLDRQKFADEGIDVFLHDYENQHPVYKQCWGGEFVPRLSAIDALFNVGSLPR